MGASLVAVAVVGLLHLGRRVLLTTRLGDRPVHWLHADLVRSLFSSGEELAHRIRNLDVCSSACGALGTLLDFFEYLNFRSLFPLEKNQIPQDLNWNRFKFLLDSFLSLAVLSFIVRFCISVAIKNWQLTGPYQVYECGLKAGQRLRLQNDLECRFEEGDRVLRKGSLCQVSNRVSPDPGVIWLSFSNGSIIPWYDDRTMFEHFERVD